MGILASAPVLVLFHMKIQMDLENLLCLYLTLMLKH